MRQLKTVIPLIICLLALAANITRAQDLDRPVLLVATADVEGVFRQAVVIVLPVGNAQHVGFIINRPSKHTLQSLFPNNVPAKKVTDPIYIGGPDALGTIYAFVRARDNPPAGTILLFDDLFVTANPKALSLIAERTPNNARFATGYISWMQDELEMEMELGIWNVGQPHTELVFRKDIQALWAELNEQALSEAVFAYRHDRKRVNRRIN